MSLQVEFGGGLAALAPVCHAQDAIYEVQVISQFSGGAILLEVGICHHQRLALDEAAYLRMCWLAGDDRGQLGDHVTFDVHLSLR